MCNAAKVRTLESYRTISIVWTFSGIQNSHHNAYHTSMGNYAVNLERHSPPKVSTSQCAGFAVPPWSGWTYPWCPPCCSVHPQHQSSSPWLVGKVGPFSELKTVCINMCAQKSVWNCMNHICFQMLVCSYVIHIWRKVAIWMMGSSNCCVFMPGADK